MTHGRNIYAKYFDMAQATICAYPQSDYALPHCKCVLCCYAHCPCINLTNRETASDSTLHSLLPPQLKQMSVRYKVMCDFEY